YSRVESGRLAIEPHPSDLAELLRESVSSCTLQAEGRLQVILDLPERLEGVWDSRRLRQVTDNLLSNAVKYSPKEGRIQVRLVEENGEAVFSVQDDGIGIAAYDQARIF